MKGPVYSDAEMAFLNKLAKRGGSPTKLAKEFLEAGVSEEPRSESALIQKIRKLMLTSGTKQPRIAPVATVSAESSNGNGHAKGNDHPKAKPANGNGNGHAHMKSGEISVELEGVRISGPSKSVGAILQQLG